MEKFRTAAILCGGKSRRMGLDKSKIKVNGKFLIEIIGGELKKIFDEVILIVDDKKKFEKMGYKAYEDLKKGIGPAGGIYTAAMAASSRYIFLTACDMPFINLPYIRYMMNVIEDLSPQCVISKNGDWVEPLHSFYSKDMIPSFERGIREKKLKLFEIIKENNAHYVEERIVRRFSSGLEVFINLNYPDDLEVLKKIYGKEVELYG